CKVMGREELIEDPRFKTNTARGEHVDELDAVVNAWMRTKTCAEAVAEIDKVGIPGGPVQTVPQVAADPQVKAREMLMDVEMPDMKGPLPISGHVIKMSKTPATLERRPPLIGEHNALVYSKLLKLSPQSLHQIKAEGII
ncbi:MAG: CoA transferase, partial [Chloroflexi bacterium]|nr:CoA transferase [Chloroflexota bacterium]